MVIFYVQCQRQHDYEYQLLRSTSNRVSFWDASSRHLVGHLRNRILLFAVTLLVKAGSHHFSFGYGSSKQWTHLCVQLGTLPGHVIEMHTSTSSISWNKYMDINGILTWSFGFSL